MGSRQRKFRSKSAARSPIDQPVLVDTNIWIIYHAGRDAVVRDRIDRLAEQEHALFIPPVRFEFARGLAGPAAAFDHAVSRYDARFPTLPLDEADWHEALRLVRLVPADDRRHAIQLTDALLAAASVRTGAFVWSLDPDLPRLRAAERRVRLFPA